jgi:hypothetical protein
MTRLLRHAATRSGTAEPMSDEWQRDHLLSRMAWFGEGARVAAIPPLDGRPGFDIAVRIDGHYSAGVDAAEMVEHWERAITELLGKDSSDD